MPVSFTCADCGRTSHHPEDVAHSYCGFCKEFKNDPRPLTAHQLLLLRALREPDPLGTAHQVIFQLCAEGTPRFVIALNVQVVITLAQLTAAQRSTAEALLWALMVNEEEAARVRHT